MGRFLSLVLVLFFARQIVLLRAQSCDLTSMEKVSCVGSGQEACQGNGCCWNSEQHACFFQTPKYTVKAISNTTFGMKLVLEVENVGPGGMPASPISPLMVEFFNETGGRLHMKITDPNHQRWEIPESVLPLPPLPPKPATYASYDYQIPAVGEEFFFSVFRRYSNVSIFNTSSIGLYFSDQYLKIGTTLVKDGSNIYGLGEHKTPLNLASQRYTLWNYDTPTPKDLNLYGSHPFYMELQGGSAHGVFLRNSNGMDVEVTESALTYRVIGGVLDFYFFVDYSPDGVVQLYQEVIGRPAMPPYWALGFHQCRWGYKDLQEVKDVVKNFTFNQIPLEAIWTDIDYMDKFRDFTTDPVNFPSADMMDFIDELHIKGQRYVVIVDPAISNTAGYKPYDDGMGMDVFIKDRANKVLIGKVWPGSTAYPDFLNPLTTEYWRNQISVFLEKVPVDGVWIDMNEPSNFCNGACSNSSLSKSHSKFNSIYPPYAIHNQGSDPLPLNSKTLDMDALHFGGVTDYNVHNLYGFMESMATNRALMSIRKGKRPFVLSRSTFSGSGAYAAHWLGDNTASEEDMYFSIPGMLNFQMFGVPMVGADICGFGGSTTEELCARWMELGAFYPFSRNHNIMGSPPQEPYRWSSVAAISRKVLSIRYSLLPYYYSLFFMANHDPNDYTFYPSSGVVVKPLFFEFPSDPTSLYSDKQFLVGSALLITPQLKLGDEGRYLDVYLPSQAVWYDWYTLDAWPADLLGDTRHLDSPLDFISIHVRGGYILPMQEPGLTGVPALTTTESRNNPYSLLVALQGGSAEGYLYLDDGETFNTTEFTFISYSCNSGEITSFVSGTKYATKMNLPLLTDVTVTGLVIRPTLVALDGQPIKSFRFLEGDTYKLFVTGLSINMDTEFHLIWV